VRRISCRSASSVGPASSRSRSTSRATVRSTAPRSRSTIATTAFASLGSSNTMPSISGPAVMTVTRSPISVCAMEGAYRWTFGPTRTQAHPTQADIPV